MIKILHLVSTFKIKTDTKWLIRLIRQIDRNRFSCVIGAFYDDGPARRAFNEIGMETFLLDLPTDYDLRVLFRLIKKIRAISPDIIHTHLLRADLYGGLAGRIMRVPVISTVYAQGEYRRAKKRISDPIIDRIIAYLPTHFIAVCNSIKDDLITRVGISADKIAVINTGTDFVEIDAEKLKDLRERYQIQQDDKIVLVPARLSYEKGIDCFLRAVAILLKSQRDSNARFIIAGDGPMREELTELANKLGISEKVEFIGFIEEIETLMSLAYAIVMPSYSEGLPNVALETFALGRPLIATRVGGITDLYAYNPNAILTVEPNSPADLADKIFKVLNNTELRNSLSQAGKDIIKNYLASDKVAKNYEQLYRTICPASTH